MYYLRKKPYTKEYTDPITKKIETVEFTSDRAVFKHKRYSRFYRKDYLCTDREVQLWKCKSLQRVLRHRVSLFNYCNEWFDIYDETNEPISDEMYEEYKPALYDTCYTVKNLYWDNLINELTDDKPNHKNYILFKKGSKLKVYRWLDFHRDWNDYNDDFNEFLRKERELVFVLSNGFHIITMNEDDYYQGNFTWIETKWDREIRKFKERGLSNGEN